MRENKGHKVYGEHETKSEGITFKVGCGSGQGTLYVCRRNTESGRLSVCHNRAYCVGTVDRFGFMYC